MRVVAALPHLWRQALILTTFEGVSAAQVGAILGRPQTELEASLNHAHAFLQARAADAGFELQQSAHIAAVGDLGRIPLPPEEREEILNALGT